MNSHQYIAAGFFAAAASFSPLDASAQTAPQPNPSETNEAWTITKYISTKNQDQATAVYYLVNCINNILKDLDSPVSPDGTPRTNKQIKNNHKLGRYINQLFPMDESVPDDSAEASGEIRKIHYQELAGFLAHADKDGKGNNTVESGILTYIALTLKAEKAANSNPDSAAEKPR